MQEKTCYLQNYFFPVKKNVYLCSQLNSITTAMTQYFTKSRFKLALDCPTKLYYASLPNVYNNLNVEDDFLQSLAEGGFQVGALAKIYRA